MHPTIAEKQTIYAMWKDAFGFDDGGSIDDYFKRNFALEHCYIKKLDNKIVACLCAHPHTMILHEKQVPVLFISGVITLHEYRHLGLMKQLFQTVMDENKECPLWVLQAYNPNIYTSLGFVKQYFQKTYTLTSAQTYDYDIVFDLQAKEMSALGNAFLNAYDGYFLRDEFWYENTLKEAHALSNRMYGIRFGDSLVGYAKYAIEDNIPHIDEIFYQDDTIKNALVSYLLKSYDHVLVDSFDAWKETPPVTQLALMVKLGNIEVLKNILQIDITSLEDVFAHTKPLYHYGFW